MTSPCDFRIQTDMDEIEITPEITEKIIYALFYKPTKNKKPCVISIVAGSGEGKSTCSLELQRIFCKFEDVRLIDYLDQTNVTLPRDYFIKLDHVLHNKELKKIRHFALHEARAVVNAATWQDFVTRAVSDVQALSRSIKPLIFMIISQDFTDSTRALRKTFNYFCEASRHDGKLTRLRIRKIYKDYRDIEKPRLRTRSISGYLITKSGSYVKYRPQYLEVQLPEKEVIEKFEEMDTGSKQEILRQRMKESIEKLDQDMGFKDKIGDLLKFYVDNPAMLAGIGKRTKGGYNLNTSFGQMHNLNPSEIKEFKGRLMKELKQEEVEEE